MRARLVTTLALLTGWACSTNGSDCEKARATVVEAMTQICAEPGYADSKFCRRCFDRGYHSTTGASVCQCRNLTFDANFCSYSTREEATPDVRGAIDWADSVCADFTPPVAIPPAEDASALDASGEDSPPPDAGEPEPIDGAATD